jgi:hypothetical protein
MAMTMTARNGNAAIPMKVLSTLIGRKRRKVSLEPRPNSVGRLRCSCGKAVDAGNSWRGGAGRTHGAPAVGDSVIGLQEPSGVIRPLSGWLIWTPGGRLRLRGSVARPHCHAAGSPAQGGRAAALADLLERVTGRRRRSSGHQCRLLKLAVLSVALDLGAGRFDLGWTRSLDA